MPDFSMVIGAEGVAPLGRGRGSVGDGEGVLAVLEAGAE